MNTKVKVVKKSETQKVGTDQTGPKATRVAAREMVSTVSDWVTEFRSRKSEETRAAINHLLPKRPRPSES